MNLKTVTVGSICVWYLAVMGSVWANETLEKKIVWAQVERQVLGNPTNCGKTTNIKDASNRQCFSLAIHVENMSVQLKPIQGLNWTQGCSGKMLASYQWSNVQEKVNQLLQKSGFETQKEVLNIQQVSEYPVHNFWVQTPKMKEKSALLIVVHNGSGEYLIKLYQMLSNNHRTGRLLSESQQRVQKRLWEQWERRGQSMLPKAKESSDSDLGGWQYMQSVLDGLFPRGQLYIQEQTPGDVLELLWQDVGCAKVMHTRENGFVLPFNRLELRSEMISAFRVRSRRNAQDESATVFKPLFVSWSQGTQKESARFVEVLEPKTVNASASKVLQVWYEGSDESARKLRLETGSTRWSEHVLSWVQRQEGYK